MLAARARALVDGRLSPSLEDIAGAGRAGAQASHGADFRRARGRETTSARDRPPGRQNSSADAVEKLSAAWFDDDIPSIREEASTLSARLPSLVDRRAASSANRAPRRARPAASRVGREFLAVPPVHFRRAVVTRRLAPLGARRARVRARERMGGGAHGVDLVRSVALDAFRLGPVPDDEDRPRRGDRARFCRPLRPGRRARRPHRAHPAAGAQGWSNGSRKPSRPTNGCTARPRRFCRRRRRPRPVP